ncbi:MAG: ABC transporter permease [Anaerolineae bacterium]|nr:ABC transporter permease [Anaerolineae bacterium]
MHNFWLVAKHEYANIVKKKSFLIGTFGIPVLIVIVSAIAIIIVLGQRGTAPLGYVDHSGALAAAVMPTLAEDEEITAMLAFADEASAQAALENQNIQGYYVLPEDYLSTGQVTLIYGDKRPSEIVRGDFVAFLRANLLAKQPEEIRRRVQEGSVLTVSDVEGSREFATDNPLNFVLPAAAVLIFMFTVMGSGGYMLQAVTGEKENRTIEILATSIRPLELIGGKALGLISVGLTQLAIWIGTAVIALLVTSLFVEMDLQLNIPWSFLVVLALFLIPSYALISGMMTAVGSAATDLQQGQQISGIFNMLFTFPLFMLAVIMAKPNSPLTLILTLFPTSAFFTIALRWTLGIVPLWQLALSWVLLVASASASIWVASRVFRMGMLQYGQPLTLKSILAGLHLKARS